MKKLIIGASIVALFGAAALISSQALADSGVSGTQIVEPTPTTTPTVVPTPTPTPSLSVSKMSDHPQMSLTRDEWEAGGFTNPYTTDEQSGYEPNAHLNPGPGEGASLEEVNNWFRARIENCKVLTEDKKYIDCVWRPWVYGF